MGLRRIPKAASRLTSYENVRTGNCLATAVPGGESPEQVATRADRVVQRVREVAGDVLLFSSGHFLRVLAARWIDVEPIFARSFMLSTASLSGLSHEHSLDQPAIQLWNDSRHVATSKEQEVCTVRVSAN